MAGKFWAEGRTMSDDHKAKLAEGRRKAAERRSAGGVERARDYMAWLKNGSVMRDIPPIPSDADCDAYYASLTR